MNENNAATAESQVSSKRSAKKKARSHRFWFVVIVLIFVWWFNNYTLKTTNVELSSTKLSVPIRIAVISDLHASKFGIGNQRILRRIENVDPDIVVMLGDMYTQDSGWDLIQIPIELTQSVVDAGYPVYFVTGEHDTDEEYIEAIAKTGAHVMNYECEYTEINGNRVQIMGIDNVYYSPTFDLSSVFTLDESCYSILLAHIPNYTKLSQFGADLTLCADTHGGMVQLPFGMGPIYDSEWNRWFPHFTTKGRTVYDKGIFGYDGGYMFITSGIGASPAPVRLNNRPEVAVIDIIPE